MAVVSSGAAPYLTSGLGSSAEPGALLGARASIAQSHCKLPQRHPLHALWPRPRLLLSCTPFAPAIGTAPVRRVVSGIAGDTPRAPHRAFRFDRRCQADHAGIDLAGAARRPCGMHSGVALARHLNRDGQLHELQRGALQLSHHAEDSPARHAVRCLRRYSRRGPARAPRLTRDPHEGEAQSNSIRFVD